MKKILNVILYIISLFVVAWGIIGLIMNFILGLSKKGYGEIYISILIILFGFVLFFMNKKFLSNKKN
jgi:uncharacterized membrane protein HdeD (DUF308 family)